MELQFVPEVIIGDQFLEKVLPLVDESKHSIKIVVYDWRLYPDAPNHPVMKLVQSLQTAARRGVDVQVLTTNNDVARQLRQAGFRTKILHLSKTVHVKLMLIDNSIAIIGSHNYTQNAFTANLEISLAVDFGTSVNDLSLYYDRLWPI